MAKSSTPDSDAVADGVVVEAEVVEVLDRYQDAAPAAELDRTEAQAAIKKLEEELYGEALDTVKGLLKFSDLGEDPEEIPMNWILEYGAAKAKKMHKLAMYGLLTRKDAPIGIQVAMDMARSERRARASESTEGRKSLNVAVVVMDKPSNFFPTIEVDGDLDD